MSKVHVGRGRSQSHEPVSVADDGQAPLVSLQRPVVWPEYWTPAAPTIDHFLSTLWKKECKFDTIFLHFNAFFIDFTSIKLHLTTH